jgi:hypothetical protein
MFLSKSQTNIFVRKFTLTQSYDFNEFCRDERKPLFSIAVIQ